MFDTIEFTEQELLLGVNYCKNKIVNGTKLYNILKHYEIPSSWYCEGKVTCLDELELFEDDNDNLTNIDFKWDLAQLIETGSCYGLSVYIFQLLEYIKLKK